MTNFIPGKVVKRFRVKNISVVLRYPKWEDLDGLLDHMNALISERAKIGKSRKFSKYEEIDFLNSVFKKSELRDMIYIVIESGNKIMGSGNLAREQMEKSRHVGYIGLSLRKEFRDLGVGTELINTLVKLGKKELGLSLFKISLVAGNERALHVYQNKCGFKVVGRVPGEIDHFGTKMDHLIMVKEV
ncbi:MAG: GNAT family N-acetyltransferase [Candidatus Aenigmarchaeota archaeon]|nr:GNAT family N-acetyltransferase [Candidatus Aenigmarchaeota archaeon]